MKFNEDSRVKIPTILHLTRLGYDYLPLYNQTWDKSTNIFTNIFNESIQRLNPDLKEGDIKRFYDEVSLCLENEDLGKAFYTKLIEKSGKRLIDFDDFSNNTLNVVTELPCTKDGDEFRPDITLLINGMPLAFIEVKKPNNRDGIIPEHKRIKTRFENKKFRTFVNITQIMVFSNNMEYDDDSLETIKGAFYATTSYHKPPFNYFREEQKCNLESILKPFDDNVENFVLKDNNYITIKSTPEFITNKSTNTPTNRICTSLFSPERLKFLLQYAIAYVKEVDGLQKHIMRYPQIFATKAIEKTLNEGKKKGIIWHTQGSGKTALVYYNVKYLTDYYQNKKIIPKFYFIVDRIDLLIQASKEFRARGLVVHEVNSRNDFAKDIKSTNVIHNNSGKTEITVVNIQKFQDDPDVITNTDYDLSIQRIFFLDEVHRSYNPDGSFLANLEEADKNSVKIGLTGTPFLGEKYNSKQIFGNYIHTYYYDSSIKDGYTLRLIREEIETSYKLDLQATLEDIKILKGDVDKTNIYAHPNFVEPMLDYVITDFERTRIAMNDNSIGAMVVCDSSKQAKQMYEIFQNKYTASSNNNLLQAAEPKLSYGKKKQKDSHVTSAALILHDVNNKQERKEQIEDFKAGKIDLLFVYNMLLTGFDAKRLKKLYLGRVIRSHNLLQALTRVNRTYKQFRYGYVVDFANIQKEFDKTNHIYLEELQSEFGNEVKHYSKLFESQEKIDEDISEIKEVLFRYNTENAEIFSQQISEINDRSEMLKINNALNNAKTLYNLIRLSGNYESLNKLDFQKLTILSRDANNRLALINTKEKLENNANSTSLLNIALENAVFNFTKVNEEEMILADKLKGSLQKTREMLRDNFDPKDPEFISLKDELMRLFKKKNLNDVSKEDMKANIDAFNKIYTKAEDLERRNRLLSEKYNNDEKYARLHKRLMEKDPLTDSEAKLCEALQGLKQEVDAQIQQNAKMLENESFVDKMILRVVVQQLNKKYHLPLDFAKSETIKAMVIKEYMNEFHRRS